MVYKIRKYDYVLKKKWPSGLRVNAKICFFLYQFSRQDYVFQRLLGPRSPLFFFFFYNLVNTVSRP